MMNCNIPEAIFQKVYGFLVTVEAIHTKNEQGIHIFLEAVYYIFYYKNHESALRSQSCHPSESFTTCLFMLEWAD
jgi:hypothetical protein